MEPLEWSGHILETAFISVGALHMHIFIFLHTYSALSSCIYSSQLYIPTAWHSTSTTSMRKTYSLI
jgi:hypothetical protein